MTEGLKPVSMLNQQRSCLFCCSPTLLSRRKFFRYFLKIFVSKQVLLKAIQSEEQGCRSCYAIRTCNCKQILKCPAWNAATETAFSKGENSKGLIPSLQLMLIIRRLWWKSSLVRIFTRKSFVFSAREQLVSDELWSWVSSVLFGDNVFSKTSIKPTLCRKLNM